MKRFKTIIVASGGGLRCICIEAGMVKAIQEREAKIAATDDAYGKVPAPEYELMRTEIAAMAEFGDKEEDHTLREDYELGISQSDGGEFYIRYHGECQSCAFNYEYKYDENLREKIDNG